MEDLKRKVKMIYEKGAFHIITGNFINKFVGLCGSIFIVRLLTKSEYGTLGYVENLYSYFYILAGFGLSAALLRYNVIAKDKQEAYRNYSYVIKLGSKINLVLVIVGICFALIYTHPESYYKATYLLPILLISLPFQDISNANLCNERAMFENKRYAYLSIGVSLISVISRVIGSAIAGVTGSIIMRLIGEIITALGLTFFTYNKYFKKENKSNLEYKKKKEINLYAFQNMVANGIWVLFIITDVFLIGLLGTGSNMLADYKVAYMLPSNMSIITSAITIFIGPYFVKNENDYEWVKNNYIKVILLSVILVGIFALFLGVFAKYIILILYGEEYLNVIHIMRILLLAHFINACFKGVTGSLLATMGQAKSNMIISFIGFSIQVTMGIIIIPRYGIMGLSIGSVFVYLLMSVILICVFAKKYNFYKNMG